ncbi:MAG TPA: hypothetical protein DCP60_05790 [Psychrobacter sp.]|jgi:hypothetical protein|uniref:hypothetical protein n=1 Tax=uncultured Psychrobacter sp. TaxID=259303 RepID=UPI000ECBE0B9|nr:hypothetical protein [uncultured Psychrobacter sp.]HAM61334.1 hypothetical protein [Psychrobacter sp.]|tara:strand:+ start:2106 stop:2891 length:786 start_codon:yes stop_codon:yes gene_type:complete
MSLTDSSNFDDFYDFADAIGERFNQSFHEGWDSLASAIKKLYGKTSDKLEDELPLPVAQKYVNDALQKFVTDNVKAILELRVELHDNWFRLFCTVDVAGIYAEVASNFSLVHVQLDRNVQRFVFGQQTYTDVLNLRCDSFIKRQGIKLFIWFYHSVLKKDPLGFILSYINIARPKDEIIYLDIHRWLKKNKKIMSALHKVQVNYGEVEEEQLVLKAQVNYRDLLGSNGDDIISEKDKVDDEPELMQGPINPVNDATEPSQE